MLAATFRNRTDRCSRFQLRDLHADFRRAFDQMFPSERVRPLRGELVVERHGIVVVEQDEVVAHGQLEPGLDDEAVFHGARNGTHVHDFVRADEGFSGCVHF